jgi:tRNA pseudouridine13 synthase
MDGDVAEKHENGACFTVEDAAKEQPRADAFEISPTGPLVGYRMTHPDGEPGRIEDEVLAESGLKTSDFKQSGKHRVKGARRSLRVKPTDIELAGGVDEHGPHITVAFTLPAGSFATVLLRELMKNDTAERRHEEAEKADEQTEELSRSSAADEQAGESEGEGA